MNVKTLFVAARAFLLLTLGFFCVPSFASQTVIRVDFQIQHYSGRLLKITSEYGEQFVASAPAPQWASNGYMLLTFENSLYANPIGPNSGQSFAKATSGQLFLDGVQTSGLNAQFSAAAYVNSVSYKSQADYGLSVQFTNNWVDDGGVSRSDGLYFAFDGYSSDKPTFLSDVDLAFFAINNIDNNNERLRAYLYESSPAGQFKREHTILPQITAVTAVPEVSSAGMMALGLGFFLLLRRCLRFVAC